MTINRFRQKLFHPPLTGPNSSVKLAISESLPHAAYGIKTGQVFPVKLSGKGDFNIIVWPSLLSQLQLFNELLITDT